MTDVQIEELATCLECCCEQLEKHQPIIVGDKYTLPRDVEKYESAIQWADALAKMLRANAAKRKGAA